LIVIEAATKADLFLLVFLGRGWPRVESPLHSKFLKFFNRVFDERRKKEGVRMRRVFNTPAKALSALAFLTFAVWNFLFWKVPSEVLAMPILYYLVVCWLAGWSYNESRNLSMAVLAAASGLLWSIPASDSLTWWPLQIISLAMSGSVLLMQFVSNRHYMEKTSFAVHE